MVPIYLVAVIAGDCGPLFLVDRDQLGLYLGLLNHASVLNDWHEGSKNAEKTANDETRERQVLQLLFVFHY